MYTVTEKQCMDGAGISMCKCNRSGLKKSVGGAIVMFSVETVNVYICNRF